MTVPGGQASVLADITNVEIFVFMKAAAVTVEEMTGTGRMIKKTRGTAVFHQEAISVPESVGILIASQEYYYPGTNHAMVTTVP